MDKKVPRLIIHSGGKFYRSYIPDTFKMVSVIEENPGSIPGFRTRVEYAEVDILNELSENLCWRVGRYYPDDLYLFIRNQR